MFDHTKKDLFEQRRAKGKPAPPGLNPKDGCDTCPRDQNADMLQFFRGKYICDACWTEKRRNGALPTA